MLLNNGFHQNQQAVLAAMSINGLMWKLYSQSGSMILLKITLEIPIDLENIRSW